MIAVRAAIGVLVVLTLTACAGEQLSLGSSAPHRRRRIRQFLAAGYLSVPNAPSCGLEFGGAPGARTGKVAPDGGCPGSFYMSRRWAMEGDALTITDGESQPLAQLKSNGTHFEGQSTAGTPVTLTR